jgi:prophage antirepressor-like protein
MNQELVLFKEKQIRVARDTDGTFGFCLQDICDAIGIKKSRNVIYRMSGKEAFLKGIPTPSGTQQTWFVNEQGLYLALSGSRKPLAKELTVILMQKLTDLRNQLVVPLDTTAGLTSLQALKIAVDTLIEHDKRLTAIESKQNQIVAVIQPVKEVSTRLKISQVVRNYAEKMKLEYKDCWKTLYYEFKYRYSIDLESRAKHTDKSKMDIAEELGCLDDLFALTITLFIGK